MREDGFLCIVLHAHLPYVRHPEHEFFLEENWLYEAITETYIPLLDVLERLIHDGIDFRITLSLSPTLVEMFQDHLLRRRYGRHIERLLALTEKELFRTKGDIHFKPVVAMYHQRFKRILHLYEDVYRKDIASAFRRVAATGKIELITTSATHAFLPNLSPYPGAVRAQIAVGAGQHAKTFGRPQGIWLPECGYAPGIDSHLKETGLRFFFIERHGVLHSEPSPKYGAYLPVRCPSEVVAFGRDEESSRQVWSSIEGYPGDFRYRDFYRDIGFDLDIDYLKPYTHPDGIRTFTGLKYYRVTGKTDNKKPYVREKAVKRAETHAHHFYRRRKSQIQRLRDLFGIRPVITATYDAELFGHWWFEGPEWLEALCRLAQQKRNNFRMVSPSEYLNEESGQTVPEICLPSMSSWGDKGYSEVWVNEANDYVYRHLLKAAERMLFLAERFPRSKGLMQRALNQAARELLLAQQSDWTFIMKNRTASGYAKKRLEEHIGRFTRLYESITSRTIPEQWLAEIEDKDRIFKDLDYRVFGRKAED
ncbi:MAG: 1,4-alpha-glucan branching protein domain-containing protein [Nitrospirota bacterium]